MIKTALLVALIFPFIDSVQAVEPMIVPHLDRQILQVGECGTDAVLDHSTKGPRQHTTKERIQNCSTRPNAERKSSSGVTWNLVARYIEPNTFKISEVWRDGKGGFLWGDRMSNYDHFNTIDYDSEGNIRAETACHSPAGNEANALISESKFGLPSIDDFLEADQHGLREILPGMRPPTFFWSSTLFSLNPSKAVAFDGVEGSTWSFFRSIPAAVRCVARP